jgi:hypothetical protein
LGKGSGYQSFVAEDPNYQNLTIEEKEKLKQDVLELCEQKKVGARPMNKSAVHDYCAQMICALIVMLMLMLMLMLHRLLTKPATCSVTSSTWSSLPYIGFPLSPTLLYFAVTRSYCVIEL